MLLPKKICCTWRLSKETRKHQERSTTLPAGSGSVKTRVMLTSRSSPLPDRLRARPTEEEEEAPAALLTRMTRTVTSPLLASDLVEDMATSGKR